MSHGLRPQRARPGTILRGIVRTALGRADGLAHFARTPQAFLSSLAPLIAFPLVGGFLVATQGHALAAAADLLATLCAVLAPPVLSFELARLWQRRTQWLHYATAFNWCQWAIPVVAIMLLTVAFPPIASALSPRLAISVVLGAVGCYGLWLHWFIARRSLEVSRLRAAVLVVVVNLGTGVLVLAPALLASLGLAKLEMAG